MSTVRLCWRTWFCPQVLMLWLTVLPVPACGAACTVSPESTRAVYVIMLHVGDDEHVSVLAKMKSSKQSDGFTNLAVSYYRKCPMTHRPAGRRLMGPPWWTSSPCKVKPGTVISRGSYTENFFTEEQQEEFGVDAEGKVVDQQKHDAGCAGCGSVSANGQLLTHYDKDHGWCEASSTSMLHLGMAETLDVGEADGLKWALQSSIQCERPCDVDLKEYIDVTKRYAIKRKETMTTSTMTSMVYPLFSSSPLERILHSHEDVEGVWLLGCKKALDSNIFQEADLMHELNESMHLWPSSCPDTLERLRVSESSGSPVETPPVLGIVALILLLLGGYVAYNKIFSKNKPLRLEDGDDARQVELTSAFRK